MRSASAISPSSKPRNADQAATSASAHGFGVRAWPAVSSRATGRTRAPSAVSRSTSIARLSVDPGDVATGERSERVERTRNLALDVEGGGETPREGVGQRDGQVRHERRV